GRRGVSSRMTSRGWCTSACPSGGARPLPREYAWPSPPAAAPRPIRTSASSTRGLSWARGTSNRRANSHTFSRPVSCASAESCWGTYPIDLRTSMARPRTLSPNTLAVPWSGWSRVARMRMVVVLPAPFGPSSPKTSPAPTSNPTPSSAWTGPKRWRRPAHCTAAGEDTGQLCPPRADEARSWGCSGEQHQLLIQPPHGPCVLPRRQPPAGAAYPLGQHGPPVLAGHPQRLPQEVTGLLHLVLLRVCGCQVGEHRASLRRRRRGDVHHRGLQDLAGLLIPPQSKRAASPVTAEAAGIPARKVAAVREPRPGEDGLGLVEVAVGSDVGSGDGAVFGAAGQPVDLALRSRARLHVAGCLVQKGQRPAVVSAVAAVRDRGVLEPAEG